MILGPFWCQRDNAWVRFTIENDKVSAEIAQISQVDPLVTIAWQSVEGDGSWPTSYAPGEDGVSQVFYSLRKGELYQTNGQINPWSQNLNVSQFRGEGWVRYNLLAGIKENNGFNPVSDYQKEEIDALTPYQQLPLTPEMVAAKLEQERILREQRIQRALEEERLRQETEMAKWDDFKKRDLRVLSLPEAGQDTLFDKQEGPLNLLMNECNKALIGFEARHFDNCAAYLEQLKAVIEDHTNPYYIALATAASRTDIDQDLGVAGDEELRRILLEQKKTIFFNLLRAEVALLCQEFNLNCELLSPEEIDERVQEQKAFEFVAEQPGFFPGDWQGDFQLDDEIVPPAQPLLDPQGFDPRQLQQAIDDSVAEAEGPDQQEIDAARRVFEGLYQLSLQEDEDEQIQQAMANSLAENPLVNHEPVDVPVDEPLIQIQIAVLNAQTKYQQWYNDRDGLKEIRGRDGFFSRWSFRHGPSGQRVAREFRDAINAQRNEYEAITHVNQLLQDGRTAYNRHSFASFLLDELRLIEGGVWSTITADRRSNLYDQDDVINSLALHQMAQEFI